MPNYNKNITIVTHSFPSKYIPIQGIFVQDQANWISRSNKVSVIAPVPKTFFPLNYLAKKWGYYHSIPFKIDNPKYSIYRPKYLTFPKKIFYSYVGNNFVKSVENIIQQDTDIFHVHFAYPGGCVIPFLKKHYPSAKTILTIHGNDWYININNIRIAKQIYQNLLEVDKIIVVGEKLHSDIGNVYPEFKNKIDVLHNGIDLETIPVPDYKKKLFQHKNKLRILMVGAFAPGKGAHVLIKSLSENNLPPFELIIIGSILDRNYYKEIKELVKEKNLGSDVSLLTSMTREELWQYYHDCDIFILPSLSEGFGIALIEAMACGKPVISTKSGGPESLVNINNGLLVEPGDSKDLARAITCMASTFQSYNSKEIKKYVKSKYSSEVVTEKLMQIYNDLD